jgi:uncharacterized protein YggE
MDRTLTTRGTGTAAGTPDAMKLSVAVAVRGPSVSDALAGTASGVRALGVVARRFTTDERITSVGLHVWPHHDNDGRQVGYEARHTLSIYCLDLAKAGELVTALGELEGRVLIEGVEPVIADPTSLTVLARERAWADALAKAEDLAALAGVSVGPVVTVVEGGASHEPIEAMRTGAVTMDKTSFESGSQSVRASLAVSWEIAYS